jgi:4-amino-4-deoxy-L-arabinose transferase-like glycosyltransferase
MPLQDFIHKFETGPGARAVKFVAALLAMLGLAVWYDAAQFRNLYTIEGMDAAQLARNVSEGHGFTTDCVRPFALHLLQKHRKDTAPLARERQPDVSNAPLYPLLLAVALKLMPFAHPNVAAAQEFSVFMPDLWIAGFNQFLFFVAVWLVFRLGCRLFDEPVGWVSAGVFAGTELFWKFSLSGQSTMLLVVLFLALTEVLVRLDAAARVAEGEAPPRRLLKLAAAAGALAGLAGLTRYGFGLMIVPVAAFLLTQPGGRRTAQTLAAAGAFLVVMLPWLVRNVVVCGTPFGTAGYAMLADTVLFPGHALDRSLNPDFGLLAPGVGGLSIGGLLWHKLITGLHQALTSELPRLGGSWVSGFFLVGLLMPFRNPVLSRLRGFLLASLGLLLVAQALGRTALTTDSPEVNSESLLVVAAPLVFLFGVSLFFSLLGQFGVQVPGYRMAVTGAFCVLAGAPLLISLLGGGSRPAPSPYYPPFIQDKAQRVEQGELILTDFPWAVAWYGRRTSVWLSLKFRDEPNYRYRNDFEAMNGLGKPFRALYLSSRMLKTMDTGPLVLGSLWQESGTDWESQVRDWETFVLVGALLKQEVVSGFPLRELAADVFPSLPEMFLLKESERKAAKTIQTP